MDILATIVDSLRISGRIHCRLEGRAPWAIEAPPSEVATFHAVEQGACWLRVPEMRPIALTAGDLVVLSRGGRHTLGDRPDTTPTPFPDLVRAHDLERSWVMRTGGRGERTTVVCGAFHFERADSSALLSLLPPVLRVPSVGGPHLAALRATLKLIIHEGDARLPGSKLAVARLTDTLLIHLLRHWIDEQPPGEAGWLTALRDRRIGTALDVIHARPLHAWSVQSLAAKAGMSRTAFATEFAALVGESPMRYVGRLRLGGAALRLRQGDAPIMEIAAGAGYESEAALSKAFKRQFGVPPGTYRQRFREPPASPSAAPRDRSLGNG